MFVSSRLMAAAGIVPLPIAARAASLLFQQVLKSHPRLFDRLGDYRYSSFGFAPSDLAFEFVIRPAGGTIRIFRRGSAPEADARIGGPLLLMLGLVEGRLDGDAVFFARKLTVTGNMEAVLALRNALDDSGIDLVKLTADMSGPIRRPVIATLSCVRRRALKSEGVRWN
ncbi:putative lipid carrier protein YhbT [Rhizobium sp. BK529]|uniref:ubiquinone anaerobic biosynthesis accessory factor UbiT n=1 Tax=unclassified Rhizobium TaxID=2613769 RepID=UPI00104FC8CE|nr:MULTISPECIES: SCP2 sterol-binding domain-containing protein [unclassified Rhizobium]MBB3593786.1 putative lipid carrier protein YhbT [Rhizobium sp. BK529]TCR95995.1 putative lipid carrier protein YhbT [Rhizobium sp. BK418]